jgi:type VI secretion system protein ImpG
MNHELLPYYERELVFLRKIAAEFAGQYPDRAAALKLTRNGCEDPHVERILEAFALIAGRLQHRLDEEFPEITNSLLELLYPHLLRPVPSLAVLQFRVDPELSKQRTGQPVPRGAIVYSRAINGVQCRFRTAYPTRLWPIEVASAAFGAAADMGGPGFAAQDARYALRIELQMLGSHKLSSIDLTDLRFRIGGDSQAAHWIYEILFNKVTRVILRPLGKDSKSVRSAHDLIVPLPSDSIRPVGFTREEALLPVAETSFQGYRLLQEYFAYPQKFLFFDIAGLELLPREPAVERFEIVFLIEAIEQRDRALLLETTVNRGTFQLGCTPAINLFEHTAEPIRLSHTKTEHEVIPDVYSPPGFEVYSVDRVVSVSANNVTPFEYRPFYSLRHGSLTNSPATQEAFWFSSRRLSTRPGDRGTDLFLSFVNRNFKISDPAHEAVTAHTTCSNRDLPLGLNVDGSWGEFDLESGALIQVRALHGPTPVRRPDFRGSSQWRLISHLSLNHLSLVDGGVHALQEILHLYDPMITQATSDQIDGITSVRSSRKIARLDSEYGFVFCQGLAIDTEMDEDRFAGGGAYLLASVLERFFGLYCAVNSFTQLRVSTRQRRGIVWQWPIRSGEQAVA